MPAKHGKNVSLEPKNLESTGKRITKHDLVRFLTYLFNNVVVCQRNSLFVNFRQTFLVDQILHILQIGVSIISEKRCNHITSNKKAKMLRVTNIYLLRDSAPVLFSCFFCYLFPFAQFQLYSIGLVYILSTC